MASENGQMDFSGSLSSDHSNILIDQAIKQEYCETGLDSDITVSKDLSDTQFCCAIADQSEHRDHTRFSFNDNSNTTEKEQLNQDLNALNFELMCNDRPDGSRSHIMSEVIVNQVVPAFHTTIGSRHDISNSQSCENRKKRKRRKKKNDVDNLEHEKNSLPNATGSEMIDSNVEKTRKENHLEKPKAVRLLKNKPYRAYKHSKNFLRKMSLKKPEDLTAKEIMHIKLRTKKVLDFETSLRKEMPKTNDIRRKYHPQLQQEQKTLETGDLKDVGNKSKDISIKSSLTDKLTDKILISQNISEIELKQNSSEKSNPFNSDTNEKFIVAFIDRSDLDGKITVENWYKVELKIIEAIAKDRDGDSEEVDFVGADWHKGYRIVDCANLKSLKFLMNFVKNCGELWPGAKLDFVPLSWLSLHRIKTTIPPPFPEDLELVLATIDRQNNLDTRRWKIVFTNKSSDGTGIDLACWVDDISLKQLELLVDKIKFGFNKLKFEISKEFRPSECSETTSKLAKASSAATSAANQFL